MSFIAELKRRNVFKVGTAYVVAAWLIIQFSDILLDNMGAPSWVLNAIMLVLAIGFFVTLFAAWAFELTPEGVKREKDVDRSRSITPQTGKKLNNAILVLMALAIGYLLFDKFSGQHQVPTEGETTSAQGSAQDTGATAEPAEAAINPKSIAVIPFNNRSRNEDDAFFVEGIHDDLLTNLARIGDLKVISRTSVLRFKDTEKPIPEIAKELGVATIMEGAVQRAGNTVRINVQLIDAQADEHLWAEIYDRELTTDNLFAIQTEISERIASELEATLTSDERQRISEQPTENLAAYNAFLRARQAMARRNAEGSDLALEEFKRAVELDPEFALAWAGVAHSTMLAFQYSDMNLDVAMPLIREATEKALALDDQLGEAHLARAQQLILERSSSSEIEAAYRQAVTLSPGYAEAWNEFSDFLDDFPVRRREALEMAQQAANLDPLSGIVQNQLISVLLTLGHYAEAELRLRDLIDQDPGFAPNYLLMSNLKFSTGQFDQAVYWRRRAQALDPGNIMMVLSEFWPLADLGLDEELDGYVARIEELDPDSSTLAFAEQLVHIYRGNIPAALESAQWYGQKMSTTPNAGSFAAFMVYNFVGDATNAREVGERIVPALFQRETWQRSLEQDPEQACTTAWTLHGSGDEGLGIELSRATRQFADNELPLHTDDPVMLGIEICHALEGDTEGALGLIEQASRTGNLSTWWKVMRHPANQELRHAPRFQAALDEIEARMAAQRENLKLLLAELDS